MKSLHILLFLLISISLIQCDVTSSAGSEEEDQDKDQKHGTVTDIDGNVYPTIMAGDQEWMAENLRVVHYRDGSEIPSALSEEEWQNTSSGAYAVYPHAGDGENPGIEGIDSEEDMIQTYGKLYNWYAVVHSPGLCPDGWRAPTDADFQALEQHWGLSEQEAQSTGWRGEEQNAGGLLKATGLNHWNRPNTGATNESGFTGLPGGFRDMEGVYGRIGEKGFWWSSSGQEEDMAWARRLIYDQSSVFRGPSDKNKAFSVRCIRKEEVTDSLAQLSTIAVTEITENSALSGGEITHEGDSDITARGVVWSRQQNPTVDENEGYTVDGEGTGAFDSRLTGLAAATAYYVRAYATNSQGTAYGNPLDFMTKEDDPDDGDNGFDDEHEYGSVTDIDGNEYRTIVIGNQEWMAHNLRVTRYRDGTTIPTRLDNTEWQETRSGAYAIYPHELIGLDGLKNEQEAVEAYGKLYNWHAAVDERGLCPDGWNVPSDDDWTRLAENIGGALSPYGNMLKSRRQVDSPLGKPWATTEHPRWHSHDSHYGRDDFGFAALPGGHRNSTSGAFGMVGRNGYWWSSSDDVPYPPAAWVRALASDRGNLIRSSTTKETGFSIRCFRFVSEDDPDQAGLPELETQTVSEITATTAVSGGNITDDGGETVTARGVVWSTSQNPTIDRNQGMTSDGSGTGIFESHLSDLDPETTYYVRAYATNSEGTAYGNQLDFMTKEDDPDDGENDYDDEHEYGSVTDIDGNKYKTIVIGDQEWMAHNLRVTRYRDGSEIPTGLSSRDWQNTDDTQTGAYAVFPPRALGFDNESQVADAYGKLYNWYAVDDERALCPAGWRVPGDDDWKELEVFLGIGISEVNDTDWRGSREGNKLKSRRQEDSPLGEPWATRDHPRWNADPTHHGTDDYGFAALPAGRRDFLGTISDAGHFAHWWTSTESGETSAWSRRLSYEMGEISRTFYQKRIAHSVRCIRGDHEEANLPEITTDQVIGITSSTAVSGGNISDDGGAEVTGRGVVWNTSQNPTLHRNQGMTSDGTGPGNFESLLSELDPLTTYYVRAYAANSAGTAYGNEVVFTTLDDDDFDDDLVYGQLTDIDGNEYKTILIGGQEWMAENLRVTHYHNGDAIPREDIAWRILQRGARTLYPHDRVDGIDSDDQMAEAYGSLYNWYATIDQRGLCPAGWHVPDTEDWAQLIDFVESRGFPNETNNREGAGSALKSCRQVNSPLGGNCDTSEHPRWDEDNMSGLKHYGINTFGFSALPAGSRSGSTGNFYNIGSRQRIWSVSESNDRMANVIFLTSSSGNILQTPTEKTVGASVRCIRGDSDDPDPVNLPQVSTTGFSDITEISAVVSGVVTADGGSEVTGRGACYAFHDNPSHLDDCVSSGSGTGSFEVELTGLQPGRTYHVRTYAVNRAGTAYADAQHFQTLQEDDEPRKGTPGEGVIDIDGNEYHTVIIGDQEWMADNLIVSRYRDGSEIPNVTGIDDWIGLDEEETGAWSYFENDESFGLAYGKLYNWYAAADSRGLCPQGWRMPDEEDWDDLRRYLISEGYSSDRNDPDGAGNQIKSCRQIDSPLDGSCNTDIHPRWEANDTHYGTDLFGFTGFPGGYRGVHPEFHFQLLGYYGYWWSNSESNESEGYMRRLDYNRGSFGRNDMDKRTGLSVRCLRD